MRSALLLGPVVLADLIVSMTGFCTVTLAGLWVESLRLLEFIQVDSQMGVAFGEFLVVGAWAGFVGIPLALLGVLFLGVTAFQLPGQLWVQLSPSRATTPG